MLNTNETQFVHRGSGINVNISMLEAIFGKNTALLTVVISVLTILISYFNYLHAKRSHSSEKRLELLVSPLFELVEPSMMKDGVLPDEAQLCKIRELINSQILLCGGTLREFRNISCGIANFHQQWIKLCNVSSSQYDKLCRLQSIPLRTLSYRIRNYKARFAIIPIMFFGIQLIVNTMCLMTILAVFMAIIGSIFTSDYSLIVQFICIGFVFLILFEITTPKQL